MPNGTKKNGRRKTRRRFLKTVALGAGTLAISGAPAQSTLPGMAQEKSPESGPAEQAEIDYPRVFEGRHRKIVAFPLGGVGSGSLSLGGRGQLCEWWIFNRPDKGHAPNYAFPSIWVKAKNRKPVVRVLESRFTPPYEGPNGLGSANVPGLPRFASCRFTGKFPMAEVDFEDLETPVKITLEAFTPFIPLEADDSGLPCAVLRYRVSNPGTSGVRTSIAFSIENPVGDQGRTNEYREGSILRGLLMTNPFLAPTDPLSGSFALVLLGAETGKVTYLRGWPSAQWWEPAVLFWDDFSADGNLGPEEARRGPVGALCLQREIPAGGNAEYTFLLAWHFPNRTPARCGWQAPTGHEKDVIGNYYCTRFNDAWSAAEYAAQHLPRLETKTRQFVSAIQRSTLPGAVKDAATSTLAALISPTCFRTADGGFHGFEGCNDHSGCCFGSCTHVWNYEAVTAQLFPSLSRSFRERQFGFLTDAEGRMDFRELLPNGLENWGVAAADGQMGSLMKLYLDWRSSGDTDWLRRVWPTAKRALEFAWLPGGWDADRDGVMEGVQHNTYDVEFIGPNPLCGVWYLGALRATEEMARALGDSDFAEECRRLFAQGSRWIDTNLFNGEYFIQKVGSIPKGKVAKGLAAGMGTERIEQPTFQLGDGCLVDQLVGQYLAEICGLGPLLDPGHILMTLQSIYKYNYKPSLFNHECFQRTFALNDEAGLVICDYSRGTRPRVPFPYYAEVMTGFEYSAAILMLYIGMVPQGVQLIESIRRRYDGERRNPWDEAECGYYYVRPMASWAAVLALSGFRYDGIERSISVRPRIHPAKFTSFWSGGQAWGTFSHEVQENSARFTLAVTHGALTCGSVALLAIPGRGTWTATLADKPLHHRVQPTGKGSTLLFEKEVVVGEGDQLSLQLSQT